MVQVRTGLPLYLMSLWCVFPSAPQAQNVLRVKKASLKIRYSWDFNKSPCQVLWSYLARGLHPVLWAHSECVLGLDRGCCRVEAGQLLNRVTLARCFTLWTCVLACVSSGTTSWDPGRCVGVKCGDARHPLRPFPQTPGNRLVSGVQQDLLSACPLCTISQSLGGCGISTLPPRHVIMCASESSLSVQTLRGPRGPPTSFPPGALIPPMVPLVIYALPSPARHAFSLKWFILKVLKISIKMCGTNILIDEPNNFLNVGH